MLAHEEEQQKQASMDQDDAPAASASEATGIPESVEVICGDVKGTYIISKSRVLYEGAYSELTWFS